MRSRAIISRLLEDEPFSKPGITLQYRPFRTAHDTGWQWFWALLPKNRVKALATGQALSRAAASISARRAARKLGVAVTGINVVKPHTA